MDRTYIDRYLVVDRYVAGDLSDRELDEFEERLVWDEELIDEVDVAEQLRHAMNESADLAGSPARVQQRWSPRQPLAAAASLAVGVLVSTLYFTQVPMYQAGSPVVVQLDLVRGSAQQIEVAPDALVVLMVAGDSPTERYRAVIRKEAESGAVWQQDDLALGSMELVAVGVPGSDLQPGRYVLALFPSGDDSGVPIREIPFEMVDF